MAVIQMSRGGDVAVLYGRIFGQSNLANGFDGEIIQRDASGLVMVDAEGMRYEITGSNLTYGDAAATYTNAAGVTRNVEGVPASGTITGLAAYRADGSTFFEASGTDFDATAMRAAFYDSFDTTTATAPRAILFSQFVLASDDTVSGTSGDDRIVLSDSVATLRSFVTADDGNDTVNAGAGNDTVIAGLGSDTVDGGAGDDTIYGDFDTLPRGTPPTTNATTVGDADVLNGGAGDDTILGRGGADTINGGTGANRLSGQVGSDTFVHDGGSDSINGGTDTFDGTPDTATDRFVTEFALADIVDQASYEAVTLQAFNGTLYGGLEFTLSMTELDGSTTTSVIREVEEFSFNGQVLTADALAQAIDGSGPSDYETIVGDFRDQTFVNRAGTQDVTGGGGNDTFLYGASIEGVGIGQTENNEGFVVWNDDGFDLLFDVDHVVFDDGAYHMFDGGVISNNTDDVAEQYFADEGELNTNGTSLVNAFVLNASSSDWNWGLTEDGNGIVTWNLNPVDGDDYRVLTNIEYLLFDDLTVDLQPLLNGSDAFVDDPNVTQFLTGTAGVDTFVLGGSPRDYGWGPTEDGQGHVVWSGDAYAILTDFEQLQFEGAGVTVTLPELFA